MKIEEALEEIEQQGIEENDLVLAIWKETKNNKPKTKKRIGIGQFKKLESSACQGFDLYPTSYHLDDKLEGFKTNRFPVYYENLISIQKIKSYKELLEQAKNYLK